MPVQSTERAAFAKLLPTAPRLTERQVGDRPSNTTPASAKASAFAKAGGQVGGQASPDGPP